MTIEIVNPPIGHSRSTSEKRARQMVRRGLAVTLSDGRLRLLDKAERMARAADCAFATYRGKFVFWNGSRGSDHCFPPGVVRS